MEAINSKMVLFAYSFTSCKPEKIMVRIIKLYSLLFLLSNNVLSVNSYAPFPTGRPESKRMCSFENVADFDEDIVGNCSNDHMKNCLVRNCLLNGDIQMSQKNSKKVLYKQDGYFSPSDLDPLKWNARKILVDTYLWSRIGIANPSLLLKFEFDSDPTLRPDKIIMVLKQLIDPDEQQKTICDEIDLSQAISTEKLISVDYDCFYHVTKGFKSFYAKLHLKIIQVKKQIPTQTSYLLFIPTNAEKLVQRDNSDFMPAFVIEHSTLEFGIISLYFQVSSQSKFYRVRLVGKELHIEKLIRVESNSGIAFCSFDKLEKGNYKIVYVPDKCKNTNISCEYASPAFYVNGKKTSSSTLSQVEKYAIIITLVVICIITLVLLVFWACKRKYSIKQPTVKRIYILKNGNVFCDIVNYIEKKWKSERFIDVVTNNLIIDKKMYKHWFEDELESFHRIIIFVNSDRKGKFNDPNESFVNFFNKMVSVLEEHHKNWNKVEIFYYGKQVPNIGRSKLSAAAAKKHSLKINDELNLSEDQLDKMECFVRAKLRNILKFSDTRQV